MRNTRAERIFSVLSIVAALFFLLDPAAGRADPVWGERIVLFQPDGSALEAFLFGDEYHVRIESSEGYTLVRDPESGRIEYAILLGGRLVPSGLAAGSTRLSRLERLGFPKHISDRFSRIAERRLLSPLGFHDFGAVSQTDRISIQALTGTRKVFVVCIQFQPEASPPNGWSSGTFSPENFDTRLFDSDPSTLSLTNFYKAQSYGTFWPEGYTYPSWITLPDTATEYKEADDWREVIKDTLDSIKVNDPLFDFAPYCNDGNMDLILIWAGTRETWGTFFWPKMGGANLNRYGIHVRYYNVVNERHSTGEENTSISTFCHEYGHMTGAPDLYDYSDFQNKPMGRYCVMGSSDIRIGFCGYIKSNTYGWVTPQEIVNGGNFKVDALASFVTGNPRMYKIYIKYPEEYLLLENRQNGAHAFYENLPGRRSGLLITHVDENYVPAACLPSYPFYGVEAICAELNPLISTLPQYSAYWNQMVWGADYGHSQVGPSYPDDRPAGSFLSLTSGEDEEHIIYRNTQGHWDTTNINITGIGASGTTMNFSVSKSSYTLTLSADTGGSTIPPPGTHLFDKGRWVSVQISEDPYYAFTRWTGDTENIQPELSFITVIMDRDISLTAHFEKIHKPLSFGGRRVLNRSFSQAEYIDILDWVHNPLNSGPSLDDYRIYVLDGGIWKFLAEVGSTVSEYWNRGVERNSIQQYKIIAVNVKGREGEPAFFTIQR